MKLFLAHKQFKNNIDVFDIRTNQRALRMMLDYLGNKHVHESVFVCFPSWMERKRRDRKEEFNTFLISQSEVDIELFCSSFLKDIEAHEEQGDPFDFSMFEFETYQDALRYCLLLSDV